MSRGGYCRSVTALAPDFLNVFESPSHNISANLNSVADSENLKTQMLVVASPDLAVRVNHCDAARAVLDAVVASAFKSTGNLPVDVGAFPDVAVDLSSEEEDVVLAASGLTAVAVHWQDGVESRWSRASDCLAADLQNVLYLHYQRAAALPLPSSSSSCTAAAPASLPDHLAAFRCLAGLSPAEVLHSLAWSGTEVVASRKEDSEDVPVEEEEDEEAWMVRVVSERQKRRLEYSIGGAASS